MIVSEIDTAVVELERLGAELATSKHAETSAAAKLSRLAAQSAALKGAHAQLARTVLGQVSGDQDGYWGDAAFRDRLIRAVYGPDGSVPFREISEYFDVSYQRVQQIVHEASSRARASQLDCGS